LSLFNELKRRNVFRVAIAYIVVAWLVMQVADVVINNITAPGWVFQVLMLFLAIGFPFAVIFAWAFEMTPEGLKREHEVDRSQSIAPQTGKKLNSMIIAVLVLALGYFAYDKFLVSSPTETVAVETQTEPVTKQTSSADTQVSDKSIAVLPFVNLSSDPEQEFFSDGISEELLNVLAQFPGLRVAARTSSFQFKGQNQDIANIAATLNVAHILEGSVRKSGNKLRITAQLIKADDGFHMWSKTYDRELTDIFAIQDEISIAISDALKVQLALDGGNNQQTRPLVIEAANTQAYEAYLRGRQLINRRGRESIEDGARSLEKAIRLDSEYAPAHAQLAIATGLLLRGASSYGDLTLDEVLARATPHIQKALALQPDLAEAHGALGLLALDRMDYMAVMEHTRRALEFNPSYIDAMNWQYLALSSLGRYEEVRTLMQRLLSADPLTIIGRLNYVNILGAERKIDEAHQMADNLISQSPWAGYITHGTVSQTFEGDLTSSLEWFLKGFEVDPGDSLSNSFLVRAFIFVGLYDEARRVENDLVFMAAAAQGRNTEALELARKRMEMDAENPSIVLDYANTLHRSGKIAHAQLLYADLMKRMPGRPILDLLDASPEPTVRMAFGRLQEGDEDGFKLAAQLITQDIAARAAADQDDQFSDRASAMLAVLEQRPEAAFRHIEKAIEVGLRDPGFFDEPSFEGVQDDPEFVALRTRVDDMLAEERVKMLQLICQENPVPNAWQPLPATCAN